MVTLMNKIFYDVYNDISIVEILFYLKNNNCV